MITDKDQIIGNLQKRKLVRTRYTRGSKQHQIHLQMNFLGSTVGQVLTWAMKDRIRRFQATVRSIPDEQFFNNFMSIEGDLHILALEAHLPPQEHTSQEQIINKLKR